MRLFLSVYTTYYIWIKDLICLKKCVMSIQPFNSIEELKGFIDYGGWKWHLKM